MVKKQRTDADRRIRQCERLGRLLRLLHLIMGKGRWDAGTLAEELECSRRTVYRLLQSLSMAGIPWFYDDTCRAYRVRPGFKFPGFERTDHPDNPEQKAFSESAIEKLIAEGEVLVRTLNAYLESLRDARSQA